MPYAATAAVPEPATMPINTRLIKLRENIWPDPGRPIFNIRHASSGLGRHVPACACRPDRPRNNNRKTTTAPVPCASTVASAAPATPIRGKGPSPKISSGSITMFNTFVNAMTRIGVWASPAP